MSHPPSPTEPTASSSAVTYRPPPDQWLAAYPDDEIDLFELVEGLWRRRSLIAAITAGAALLAILYAWFLASPEFRASTLARPPGAASLVALNESQLVNLTPTTALSRVVFEAQARDAQRSVFLAHKQGLLDDWPEDRDEEGVFLDVFAPAVAISVAENDKETVETTLSVGFTHGDPDYAATVANAILAEAHRRARSTVIDELMTATRSRLSTLRARLEQTEGVAIQLDLDEIARLEEADERKRRELRGRLDAVRSMEQRLRDDRITQLEEALTIAESLDLQDPENMEVIARRSTAGAGKRPTAGAGAGPGTESLPPSISVAMGSEQEYLKGTRLLRAELDALRSRESNDPFSSEIREIEAELAMLEHNPRIDLLKARTDRLPFTPGVGEIRSEIARFEGLLDGDYSAVQLMRVDQPATAPRTASKPRRRVILAAAIVAGGMLGILVALIMNAAASRQRVADGAASSD